MSKSVSEWLELMFENESMRELITMPGADFNLVIEVIKRKRFETQGFRYADEHNPATAEHPEG